jgi:rare lipoprotein A
MNHIEKFVAFTQAASIDHRMRLVFYNGALLLLGAVLFSFPTGCAVLNPTTAPQPSQPGAAAPGEATLPQQENKAAKANLPQMGEASWYGGKLDGKKTASGETFDQSSYTAAHRNLPFGTKVKVTNLENGKSVNVEIVDRGPFAGGRIIDLSHAAAKALDMKENGTAQVRIEALQQ